MKNKFELMVTVLLCSFPGFVAGWKWSETGKPNNAEPVRQVIEAIEATPSPLSSGDTLETAAIFDSLHDRTVTSFVETFEIFGFGRILRAQDLRHTELWTLHPGRSDGFRVALIGLEREEPVRFEPQPPDPEDTKALRMSLPAERVRNLPAPSSPRKPGSAAVSSGVEVPLDSLDRTAIAKLAESKEVNRAILSGHDSVIGFGPIRLSASCLKCHDGDAGDLVGIFRYNFPLPGQSLGLRLAGNP